MALKINFNKDSRLRFIQILLAVVLLLFTILVKDYIVSLVLAIIFAGLSSPVYNWFLKRFKGRKKISSITTLIFFLLVIVIPSVFLLFEIVDQASMVSKQILPFLEKQLQNQNIGTHKLPDWIPFRKQLTPYTEDIFSKISELIGSLSQMIVDGLGSLTKSTFAFFLNAFVMLYGMYYFLVNGSSLLKKTQYYLPLTKTEFKELTSTVISISKATIKGAFLIGILQGVLVGIGFSVAGIPGAVFWGSIAAILSVIPSVGTSIVYVPAGLYLLFNGEIAYGIGLLIWGFGVVSSVDNFLRPMLVGKDTQMPDVIILVTTLGGIGMFGISGIVIGPLIAGLLMSILKIYRKFLSKT